MRKKRHTPEEIVSRLQGAEIALINKVPMRAETLKGHLDGLLLAASDRLHEAGALLFQDPLHALDGIALAVEEMTDTLEEIDVVGAVVTPAATALERTDLREAGLPEAQHVLRHADFLGGLGDGAESFGALRDAADFAHDVTASR